MGDRPKVTAADVAGVDIDAAASDRIQAALKDNILPKSIFTKHMAAMAVAAKENDENRRNAMIAVEVLNFAKRIATVVL